jgi:hypothetical protein
MKKSYILPDFEVIAFSLRDVLTSSTQIESNIPVDSDPFTPEDPGGEALL